MTKTAQELADEAKRCAELYAQAVAGQQSTGLVPPQTLIDRGAALYSAIDALLSLAQASQARTDGGAVAWMHPDGRVVPASTMATAKRDGGASASSLAGYTIPLFPPGNATQAAGAREPLTAEQMESMYDKASAEVYRCRHDYYAGILDAERFHGIASPAAELKKD